MVKRRTFSRILPLGVIVIFILVIGVSMISAIRSEDKKDQKAWNEVLDTDARTSDQAKVTLSLVDKLDKLQAKSPGNQQDIQTLKNDICKSWPSFYRQQPDGQTGVPPVQAMRKVLRKYIRGN